MRAFIIHGLLISASLCLLGCGKNDKAGEQLEKGQVIASVDGEDITIYELNAELQEMSLPAGVARKKVEQATLQKIIDRKILANLARERKLDKTPQYLLQTRRADEQLLANLVQQAVATKTPPPSTVDVEKYISENPWMFRERKLFLIDQIQFPMPADRKDLMAYQPLKTLDEVEQKLVAENIDYRRVPTSLDTLQLPAQMVKSITTLPPGEVFVIPSGGALTANRIVEVRPTPLTGPEATKYAKEMVRRQRAIERTRSEFDPLINAAKAKISYQEGYEPSPAKPEKGTPMPASAK